MADPAPFRPGADLAGVVLAAGAGTRLRPLTLLRPKALCPVGNVSLLDWALDRLAPLTGTGPERVAVNTHHHRDQVAAHVRGRAHLSREEPGALGTAGALGALRTWLDGRDVAVTNADLWTPLTLAALGEGWDRERCRLCVVPSPPPGDFRIDERPVRYVGACLLPWRLVARLDARPSGLFEVLWRDADLDLVVPGAGRDAGPDRADGPWVDCGTPHRYLAANLSSGAGVDPAAEVTGSARSSVVGAGAVVAGRIHECVVWPGAAVAADEDLTRCVRAGTPQEPLTVRA